MRPGLVGRPMVQDLQLQFGLEAIGELNISLCMCVCVGGGGCACVCASHKNRLPTVALSM